MKKEILNRESSMPPNALNPIDEKKMDTTTSASKQKSVSKNSASMLPPITKSNMPSGRSMKSQLSYEQTSPSKSSLSSLSVLSENARSKRSNMAPVGQTTHSTVNRNRMNARIEQENLALLRRIEALKPSKGLRRTSLHTDHTKHANLTKRMSRNKQAAILEKHLSDNVIQSFVNRMKPLGTETLAPLNTVPEAQVEPPVATGGGE